MAWREYLIRFPIALLISWGVWIIPLWIGIAFQDAKKRRKHEKEECYYQRKNAELDQRVEELEEDNKQLKSWINDQQEIIEGMRITINLYEKVTGISDIDIGSYLKEQNKEENMKKRNKRKKRK